MSRSRGPPISAAASHLGGYGLDRPADFRVGLRRMGRGYRGGFRSEAVELGVDPGKFLLTGRELPLHEAPDVMLCAMLRRWGSPGADEKVPERMKPSPSADVG